MSNDQIEELKQSIDIEFHVMFLKYHNTMGVSHHPVFELKDNEEVPVKRDTEEQAELYILKRLSGTTRRFHYPLTIVKIYHHK